MRLIDADALTVAFAADSIKFMTYDFDISAIETEIASAPTIEAEPVVHAHITGTRYNLHCSNCEDSADIGNDYCPTLRRKDGRAGWERRMKPNPCPYETCVNYKDNDCDSHQIEVCVKLREEYAAIKSMKRLVEHPHD